MTIEQGTIAKKIERGVYVIAEIGCNHGGSVDTAKRMIDAAAWCGVDAVKLQKRHVASMPEHVRNRPYNSMHSFGATYGEHRQALEFDISVHADLALYAHARGLDYGLSYWDRASVLESFDCGIPIDFAKVPSALVNNEEFVDCVSYTFGAPVIYSTGMSTWADVEALRDTVEERRGESYVLHAVSAYPCENVDVNLKVLSAYARLGVFKAFGLSGHHRGIQIDAGAVALGARILERHFSLDRTSKGTDHAASLERDGLRKLARDAQVIVDAMGDGVKRVMDCELPAIAKLREA